jgi:alkylation response protein AidB-like acyl-CoA dehydrogenase
MKLLPNDEQVEFRAAIAHFLERRSTESDVRKLMVTDDGHDPAVWAHMADQLELQGLVLPERFGGGGFSLAEAAIVFEEAGRALLCAPYFATVAMAATLLVASADEGMMSTYLPLIADGSLIATVAVIEDPWSWRPESVHVRADQRDGSWVINGVKSQVLDGALAGLIIVVARTDDGVSLFAVDGDAPGLAALRLSTLDQTRKQSRLDFVDVPAKPVGMAGRGWEAVEEMLDFATVALAAEQLGVARAMLDRTVSYAGTRMQFGRAIGSFQSVKHKCANLLVSVELARSAVQYAVWAADEEPDDRSIAANIALTYASRAAFQSAADGIQIHGGIGFTWEHPAHLFLKRAKSNQILLGGEQGRMARLADALNL